MKPILILAMILLWLLPGNIGQFLSTHAQGADFRPYRELWRLGDVPLLTGSMATAPVISNDTLNVRSGTSFGHEAGHGH